MGTTLINILMTIMVYAGARQLAKKVNSPLATPVFTSTLVIIALLIGFREDYDQYKPARDIMTFLLGPATVALAIPIYENRELIKKRLVPAAAGLVIGIISTILSAVWLSIALGLSEKIQATAAVKAVTTPVAIETTKLIGGDPALAAAFVITAGIFGAVFGAVLLNIMGITDPFSRGLGIGTVSHGIGTSQAIVQGPIQGAVSSAAMGLSAIITALILPWIYPWIQ
ncbi:LrgB family protein [Falsibacillus albus]|uniref:LrgB family protein n=1 Tax=Falsibacillus albus TaxID=2478915 RepID=A0A3L7JUU8_9BACI|nr:LrgB family protein [Falsibacillus albus]RLQ94280.1 LrgB family protein [Falsibacillus albus]